MPSAHLYVRVRKHHPLESQKDELIGFCNEWLPGYDMKTYVDEERAIVVPLKKRPAGQQLMHCAVSGDIVLTPRCVTIWHTPTDMANTFNAFEKRGVRMGILEFGEGGMNLTIPQLKAMAESYRNVDANMAAERAHFKLQPVGTGQPPPKRIRLLMQEKILMSNTPRKRDLPCVHFSGVNVHGPKGQRTAYYVEQDRLIARHMQAMRDEGMTWHAIWRTMWISDIRTSRNHHMHTPRQCRQWVEIETMMQECERRGMSAADVVIFLLANVKRQKRKPKALSASVLALIGRKPKGETT